MDIWQICAKNQAVFLKTNKQTNTLTLKVLNFKQNGAVILDLNSKYFRSRSMTFSVDKLSVNKIQTFQ